MSTLPFGMNSTSVGAYCKNGGASPPGRSWPTSNAASSLWNVLILVVMALVAACPQGLAHELQWQKLHLAAHEELMKGNYPSAEKLARHAIAYARKNSKVKECVGSSMSILAEILIKTGRTQEAERAAREALLTLQNPKGDFVVGRAGIYYVLARVAVARRQYAEAKRLFDQTIQAVEQSVGPYNPFLSAPLLDYAALLRKLGEKEKAARLAQRCASLPPPPGPLPPPPNYARTISFPQEIKFADVYAVVGGRVRLLGPASGSVSLPAGATGRLHIFDASPANLALVVSLPRYAVQSLTFAGSNLRSNWVRQLRPLKGVYDINFYGTDIDDGALPDIATIDGIMVLNLGSTRVSPTGLKYLGQMKALKELRLTRTSSDDTVIDTLAGLKHLTRLYLSSTSITDSSLERFSRYFPFLATLNLSKCNITDRGVQALSKCRLLNSLDLDHTLVSEKGLAALRGLPYLSLVTVRGTRVASKEKAHKALPDCQVEGP